MFDLEWLSVSLPEILAIFINATGIYIALIVLTRAMGLRSFSKMSSFDFAITVAIGSVVATVVVSKNPSLLPGVAALTFLYLLQNSVARWRARHVSVARLVDNQPLLIMDGAEIIHENLKASKMTEADLYAKLRESNVTALSQVYAAVFEATGDVSVLHSGSSATRLDERLLQGVNVSRDQ